MSSLSSPRSSLWVGGIALAVFALVIGVDNPSEQPADGMWQSALDPLGWLIFVNLSRNTGIEALRFPLLDLLVIGLVVLGVFGVKPRPPAVSALEGLLLVSTVAMFGIEGWGIARGGDFHNSLYQLQQLTALPLLALALGRILDVRRDLLRIGAIILGAFVAKLAVGLYFYEVICRPMNFQPPWTNTHSDSVLFVVALVMVGSFAFFRRTTGALAFALAAIPAIVLALHINNRRLAWVAFALVLLVLYAAAPASELKKKLMQGALGAVPVGMLYLAAGWTSTAGVFRPVAVVRSVVDSDQDRSTETRDIENFNLIWTFKQQPLLGSGFGHEYMEMTKADDISSLFPQYRFVPHNSLLGLWAFGGALGFGLAWLPIIASTFLAARALVCARTSIERTATVTCLATFVTYAVQAYGDMGLQSWPATFLLAVAIAVTSQLAAQTGAFPAYAPLLGTAQRTYA